MTLKEKIKDVANLSCSTDAGIKKLNSRFEKVMQSKFSKYYYDDMSADDILKVVAKLDLKYRVHLSYMFFSRGCENGISISIVDCNKTDDNLVSMCYADTILEGLKKTVIIIYLYVKGIKENEQ